MRGAESLEKILMLGKIEGRRRRGHQRVRWLVDITDAVNICSVQSLSRVGLQHTRLPCPSPIPGVGGHWEESKRDSILETVSHLKAGCELGLNLVQE